MNNELEPNVTHYVFSRIVSSFDDDHIDYEHIITTTDRESATFATIDLFNNDPDPMSIRISVWRGDMLRGPFKFVDWCDYVGLRLVTRYGNQFIERAEEAVNVS